MTNSPMQIAAMISGVLLLPNMLILVIISRTKLRLVQSNLKGSTYVSGLRISLKHGGVMGRLIQLGAACTVLLIPSVFVRKGLADATEIKNFPRRLKWLITLPNITSWILLGIMMAGTGYEDLGN